MKLGIIVSSNDPETLQNALEFASFSLSKKDSVKVYLLGKGVELEVHGKMEGYYQQPVKTTEYVKKFIDGGGQILASKKCFEFRQLGVPEFCTVSSVGDLYNMIQESDRILTF
jgi:uncharacterized protein involved in oxidation of intracellular sulfur